MAAMDARAHLLASLDRAYDVRRQLMGEKRGSFALAGWRLTPLATPSAASRVTNAG
jgi:hypothetical protein